MSVRPFCIAAWLAPVVLVAGCATEPARKPAPQLAPGQQRSLAAAEKLYRAGDPAFATQRDQLAADPVTAYWLARLFIYDLTYARDQQQLRSSDARFLAAVAAAQDPVLARAKEQLISMGAAAVPALVEDLLMAPHSDRRHLGVLMLGEMGPVVLPGVTSLLDSTDWRRRLSVIQVAAAMGSDEAAIAVLERGAADRSFAVRAEAVGALLARGGAHLERARRLLAQDPDPYVRRYLAAQLGDHPDPETADVLVSYLSDCLDRVDPRGAEAAEASLIKISGKPGSGDLGYWRAWLATYSREGRR